MGSVRLFCTYAPQDQPLWQELESHLKTIPSARLEAWSADKIDPGEDWSTQIATRMEEASIFLILVSSDLIAAGGRYAGEMRRAVERHNAGTARVIPVILRPVEWRHADFGGLEPLPKDGRPVTMFSVRDEAWVSITRSVDQLIERWQADHSAEPPISLQVPSSATPTRRIQVVLLPPLVGVTVRVLSEEGNVLVETLSQVDGTVPELAVPRGGARVVAQLSRRVDQVTTRVEAEAPLRALSPEGDVPVIVLGLPYSLAYADARQRARQGWHERFARFRRRWPRAVLVAAALVALPLCAILLSRNLLSEEKGFLYVPPINYTPGFGLAGLPPGSRAHKVLGVLSGMVHREGLNQEVVLRLAFSNPPQPEPVTVNAFFLDRSEVTVADYKVFLDRASARDRAALGPDGFAEQLRADVAAQPDRPGYPVHSVTWTQADGFCRAHGGRLPTSPEWEVAARNLRPTTGDGDAAADGTTYPWGDDFYVGVAQTSENAESRPARACALNDKTRVHPTPICDLGGNLREWLADEGPSIKGGSTHHVRGATYESLGELSSIGYVHYLPEPTGLASPHMGFRCAYDRQPERRGAVQVTSGGRFKLGRPDDPLFEYLSRYGGVVEFLLEEAHDTQRLGDLFIQARKVTMGEYRAFLRKLTDGHDSSCREQNEPVDHRHAVPDTGGDDTPVLGLSWYDAHAYCAAAGWRLPTADEWERVVRGERAGIFAWGGHERGRQALSEELTRFVGQVDPHKEPVRAFVRSMFMDGAEWTNSAGWRPGTRILKGLALTDIGCADDPILYVTTTRAPRSLDEKVPGAGFRCVFDRRETLLERLRGTSRRTEARRVEWPPLLGATSPKGD